MDFGDLIYCDDEQFIVNCYHLILGREPDSDGFNHYLSTLKRGQSRARLARAISRSSEGRARRQKIQGLRAEIFWSNLLKLTGMRSLFRLIKEPSEANILHARIMSLENTCRQLISFSHLDMESNKRRLGKSKSEPGEERTKLSPRAFEVFEELRG